MPVKFLLINAIDPYMERQYRFPELGLGYLASSLRNHFGPDTFQFKIVNRDIEGELDNFDPDIVGITAVTQNYGFAKRYAHEARKRSIPVIMGGIHISTLPQTLTSDMDVAVLGEGEQTIIELLDVLLKRGRGNLPSVDGIAFRDETGKFQITPPRKPISPLDQIPFPARDLMNIGSHSSIFSSRGCPYHCIFCAPTRYWSKLRYFSAEYVVEELKEMVGKYGVKIISFYDDLMIADINRMEDLVILIRKERSLDHVKFSLNVRSNLMTEETARLLESMRVVSVNMGMESGNGRVLQYLKGSNISVAHHRDCIDRLHRHGIKANASFVIGSPDETKEEILDTLNFIKTSGLDFVETYVLTPFPGNPIWDYAKSIGVVSDDMDWSRFTMDYYSNPNPIHLSSQLTSKEIKKLYRKFKIQRWMIAAKSVWSHPFLKTICKATAKQYVNAFKEAGSCLFTRE